MQAGVASRTAYRVALRRAAHQVFDDPVVFQDPYALLVLGLSADSLAGSELRAPKRASSASLRAFLVARSLFAEESLARFVETHGVSQYVLLGAGLDTFLLRNPYSGVRVFEVDHPATQAWKRDLLRENDLTLPAGSTLVANDFERDDLRRSLQAAGFQAGAPTLFAMLGVVPYLTEQAFAQTLGNLDCCTAFRAVVMDYGVPREALPLVERLAFDSLAQRVAQAGEPFHLFLTETQMDQCFAVGGLHIETTLSPKEMNERFFAKRGSRLRVLGSGARLVLATGAGADPLHACAGEVQRL